MQIDIPVKYLGFFLEDDAELEHIKRVRYLCIMGFDWGVFSHFLSGQIHFVFCLSQAKLQNNPSFNSLLMNICTKCEDCFVTLHDKEKNMSVIGEHNGILTPLSIQRKFVEFCYQFPLVLWSELFCKNINDGCFYFFFLKNGNVLFPQEYGAGRMLTGEVKQRLTEVLTEIVERHRRARAAVTDEVIIFILVGLSV